MRRNLDKPSIPWGIFIPVEDFEGLSAYLSPVSRNWLAETGLRKFLELVEPNSSEHIRRWIHQDIQRMLHEAEPLGAVKELSISVPTSLYVRFSVLFGEFGAASWFVRRYIHYLVKDLRDTGQSLEDRIEAVISRAMRPEELAPEGQHV